MTDWQERYKNKIVSADSALSAVNSGDRVVVGHAAGEPQYLVEALVQRAGTLRNVEVLHMVSLGPAKYAQRGLEESFRHNAFFLGAATRAAVAEGRADFTPCFFSEIPRLFSERIIPVDVALIQVTPPDEDGFCSYGVSVDYTCAAASNARIVIAQINGAMPRTMGARISMDDITCCVVKDQPIIELPAPVIGDVERKIGENVASLVPDGATLQLGIGGIPDAVLLSLDGKNDLGLHSEMFSDSAVDLIRNGNINNTRKTINRGVSVASFLMGTNKLYSFVDCRPDVQMRPVDYVNDPCVIGQHDGMVCINSAIQVDLTGQVNAEMIGARQFSGVGGQVDFFRGASRSKGGKAIIAIPATAARGQVSRICASLDPGACVSTSRADVHYVVTEFGIADLRGKSLRQRAKALIDIAHPDFHPALIESLERRMSAVAA